MARDQESGLGHILVRTPSDIGPGLGDSKGIPMLPGRRARMVARVKFRRDFLCKRKLDHVAGPYLADPEVSRSLKPLGLPDRRPAMLSLLSTDHLAPCSRHRHIRLEPSSELDGFAPELALIYWDARDARVQPPLCWSVFDKERAADRMVEEQAGPLRPLSEPSDATVTRRVAHTAASPLCGGSKPAKPYTASPGLEHLNVLPRRPAIDDGILLRDPNRHVGRDGRKRWIGLVRWHFAQQPVGPRMFPLSAKQSPVAGSQTLTGQIRSRDGLRVSRLVSVVIARSASAWPMDALLSDTLSMSCDVLRGDVDRVALKLLLQMACEHGAGALIAAYVAAVKDAPLVQRDRKRGFEPVPGPSGALSPNTISLRPTVSQ